MRDLESQWTDGDLPLLERLMGDPAMTEHLGGPEASEKILERQERYVAISGGGRGAMFVMRCKMIVS